VIPAVVLNVGASADADVATVLDVAPAVVLNVGASADADVATVLDVIPAVVLNVGASADADVATVLDVTETAVRRVGAIADADVAIILADMYIEEDIDADVRDATAPALGALIVVLVGPDVVAGSSRSVQDTATCLDVSPANVPVIHSSRVSVFAIAEYSVEVRY